MSNFTDLDALGTEPGVRVRFTRSPADVERADLVVVPGTKATVADLQRLRATGLDRALADRAAAQAPILGICGGYQLLGGRIDDDVESRAGSVDGLGLLPVATVFEPDKVLRRRAGECAWLGGAQRDRLRDPPRPRGAPRRRAAAARPTTASPTAAGAGWTLGTSWHGALEDDGLRRALLRAVAAARGRELTPGTALVRRAARAAPRRARRPRRGATSTATPCSTCSIRARPPSCPRSRRR